MNSMRGGVPFEVEGKDMFLRITTNGQVAYEDVTGESYFRGIEKLRREPSSVKRIRALAFAGMTHMPGVTINMVGEIMDTIGVVKMAELVGKAIAAAAPEPTEVAEGNAEGAKPAPK